MLMVGRRKRMVLALLEVGEVEEGKRRSWMLLEAG